MTHALKTWSEFYQAIESGVKKFELRQNDRDYKVGDTVILQDFNGETKRYTGKESTFVIEYILSDAEKFGLKKGYVILGLKEKDY